MMYALLMFVNAIAYTILQRTLLRINGRDTAFSKAIAVDVKGRASLALYAVAIGLAFVSTVAADVLLVAIALLWLVPDRRFEPLIDVARSETDEVTLTRNR
ncbi:MAG: hypothetical protein JO199_01775 [Candidatus Eremiobacteraeota bacterium]|nr:hypothetical protein [Candidatus Eremiobacteraeota bacterium]